MRKAERSDTTGDQVNEAGKLNSNKPVRQQEGPQKEAIRSCEIRR
jgi:hypothetical protein